MKFKFLSFAFAFALASANVFGENIVVSDSLVVSGNVMIGRAQPSRYCGLEIHVPYSSRYLIQGYDNARAAYPEIFHVDRDGGLAATSLLLKDSSVGNTNSANLRCSFGSGGWVFSTNSYPGQYYGIQFNASSFTFDKGDMIVNGNLTCKDQLKVAELDASNIKADDININLHNAADYVFDENYDLKPLREVESFVKENKHLPGVPSAAEMEQNGVSVSAMSNILLEKIEELTLHVIRLEKENEALKAKVQTLEK